LLDPRTPGAERLLPSNRLRLPGFGELNIDVDHSVIQVSIGIAIRDQRQGISHILGCDNRERRHIPP